MIEGLEYICKTIARYAAIENLYLGQHSPIVPQLEESILGTYVVILGFLAACRRHFDSGLIRRLAMSVLPEPWVTKHLQSLEGTDGLVIQLTGLLDAERLQSTRQAQDSFSMMVSNLNNQVGSLHSEVTIRTSDLMDLVKSFESPLIRTRQELSDFTERQRVESATAQSREERKEILQWLSTIPYKSHHRVISEKILTDTGSWLMNDPRFTGWMNSSVTSVLWLHSSRTFLALRKSHSCGKANSY